MKEVWEDTKAFTHGWDGPVSYTVDKTFMSWCHSVLEASTSSESPEIKEYKEQGEPPQFEDQAGAPIAPFCLYSGFWIRCPLI